MINRLIDPSAGRILCEGTDITTLRGVELRRWRARAAMIFQQFNLVGRLDVLTNVLMGRLGAVPTWRSLTSLWPAEDKAIAMSALEQFDIAALAATQSVMVRMICSSLGRLHPCAHSWSLVPLRNGRHSIPHGAPEGE